MSQAIHDYSAFDQAYDYFNAELFAGKLPLCYITLQRKGKRNLGYYSPDRFVARSDGRLVSLLTKGQYTDEIALNPDNFTGRSDKDILATLVHEMAHLWQQKFGTPPRKAYHDRQWGAKMEAIGLMPSHTGEPGGKRTGQQMHHYIIPGGAFELACDRLLATGFCLAWQSRPCAEQGRVSRPSKVKYTCPTCEQNAWAKPDANLVCGECMERMIHQE
jgi:predicted SprT family Zn-dependent metalloprotease